VIRRLVQAIAVGALLAATYMALHRYTSREGGWRVATPKVASAPHIALTGLDGNSFNTSTFRGKVLVVNFWAAWCAPCTAEIPQFVSLQEKYRQQGLQVLGISMDDADDVLRKFYSEHKMNYPVVAGDLKSADAYGGVPGLPTTYIYARDGRLESRLVGATDFQSLEREVVALLETSSR
jgi:peroxiredoxin